jgi:hypothetical protein
MWAAGPRNGRPQNYLQVARIDVSTMKIADEPDIWSNTAAWAYGAAAPNERGELGWTAFVAGPSLGVTHVVGIRDDAANVWTNTLVARSDTPPPNGAWGDYLTVKPHAPLGHTWVAAGHTLNGGVQPSNVLPRYVHFGDASDAPH